MDAEIFEMEQRVRWYINGIGIHCLPVDLFFNLPTKRLCELYNVEMTYFKK